MPKNDPSDRPAGAGGQTPRGSAGRRPLRLLLRIPRSAWRRWLLRRLDGSLRCRARSFLDWEKLHAAAARSQRPALIVLEARLGELLPLLQAVERLARLPRGHRIAVIGEATCRPAAAALREAGAVECCFSMRAWPRLERLAARHAETLAGLPESLEQAIIESLPWPAAAREAPPRSADPPPPPTAP